MMDKSDLIKILHGDITRLRISREQGVYVFNVEVTMYPADVKYILLQYLSDKISADDLWEWARYILINSDVYRHPRDHNDDEESDYYYYETMWYVIQRLSTPFLDGEITKPLVERYLTELSQYKD